MATSKVSKQLRLKNLDQDTLDQVKVIEANLEAFKNTGILHFLHVVQDKAQNLFYDLDG